MAQNITLLGASYSSVPAVTLPKTGGGTAQFDDTTDANATASDIASGKTAYVNGVKLTGTSSGGGGGSDAEDGIIDGRLSGTYENSRITTIKPYAFYSCQSLKVVNFPNVTSAGAYAFSSTNISSAIFPALKTIGSSTFRSCAYLTNLDFPALETIGASAFFSCFRVETASFPKASSIGAGAFMSCSTMGSIYFLGSSVPNLVNVTAFSNTRMSRSTYTGGWGSIYVPASLYSSYITATNWKSYSARIVSV